MDWKGIPVTDGTGQQDRQLAALETGYFDVDELSFENLLAMAAEFAPELAFYNLDNEIDGDWGGLFARDEAVAMAQILSADPGRMEREFLQLAFAPVSESCRYLLGIAGTLDRWHRCLAGARHQAGELLAIRLATIIDERLVPELHNLGAISVHTGAAATGDFANFAAIWKLGEDGGEHPFARATRQQWRNQIERRQQLSAVFDGFANAISLLKTAAATRLPQSLDSGRHEPALGLFMVFLKLYARAQRELNTFTGRHRDFFYHRILGTAKRDAVAENYYLSFASQPAGGRCRVPAGTGFSAGKDAEFNDIVYLADDELVLTDTRIESLATLYLQQDFLVSPEYEMDAVTRMKVGSPPTMTGEQAGGDRATPEQAQPPSAWSLFGGDAASAVAHRDARIGFCVASSTLLLEQGERGIDLRLRLESERGTDIAGDVAAVLRADDEASFRRRFGVLLSRYLVRFQGCLDEEKKEEIVRHARQVLPPSMAREIRTLLRQDWQGLFYRIFKRAFALRLTTPGGWLDVRDYSVQPYAETLPPSVDGIGISLKLGRDEPPVCGYRREIHGERLDTPLPVLQCVLNPRAGCFVYSILRDLVVTSLQIDVAVEGLKNLLAYNQHGQIDPSKPFQPFGPMPAITSYFIFGNYELARKNLQALELNLEWGDLPRDPGGFEEYYHGYTSRFGSLGFRGRFSALTDGHWMPADSEIDRGFELFATEPAASRLVPERLLSFDRLDFSRPIDCRIEPAEYRYDLRAATGFFRLSLVAPEAAFGHDEYTRVLTAVLAANARRRKQAPVPKPPYTPILNGVSLNYRATAVIDADGLGKANGSESDSFIHLHPFGVDAEIDAGPGKMPFLLPRYEHAGNLFIGIEGSHVAGPLSLLFHLAPGIDYAPASADSKIEWYYLGVDGWRPLPPENLLTDSTHGFVVTGIVKLVVPEDIARGNRVMPEDCCWLRVSTGHDIATRDGCYSIRPHALKVSRARDGSGSDEFVGATPAAWAPIGALPGVGQVSQPAEAFGGRRRESDAQKRTRIAERLRHKNRAVLPRDYEQMILERFPEIQKVKCFSAVSSRDEAIRPGQVLIVVVPGGVGDGYCLERRADARTLGEISAFIERHSSAFVDIEIRNPAYERIQVRCTVKFSDSAGNGSRVDRLDRQISEYICPWNRDGYRARFGWTIKQQDIESHIRHLDYVDHVTNFSMLQITLDNEGSYHLFDTAGSGPAYDAVIAPRYPWSLALPADKHFIETMPSARSIEAEVTGVDELAIGSTFIISGNGRNGEEK